MIIAATLCALVLSVQAGAITIKESAAPDSIIKLTPTGAKSLRFAQVNYGVSGGKLLLHEYRIGDPDSAVRYLDILTPSGKRLQKFQLGYAPETVSRDYKIRPLWVIPARKKLPALHFEGLGAHLFVVFPKGFAQPGSQQFLSELDGNKKRLISFDELDRRGYRMIRIDVDEPAVDAKPAYKGTSYYFWSGTKFEEKKR
jgi:hypothetical protein